MPRGVYEHKCSSWIDRSWKYADTSAGPDACWLWTGGKDGRGYGMLSIGGRKGVRAKAHRLAWELHNGRPMPADKEGCHKCNNKLCVNPTHIYPGTHAENMADMRGRSYDHNPRRGDQHPGAKLTEQQVLAIRARYTGTYGEITRFARESGMSRGVIASVVHRRLWQHI